MKYRWEEQNGLNPCPDRGGWDDEDFYYRPAGSLIQVGVKDGFDRWANSADYEFSPPKTAKAWEKIRDRLRKDLLLRDDPGPRRVASEGEAATRRPGSSPRVLRVGTSRR